MTRLNERQEMQHFKIIIMGNFSQISIIWFYNLLKFAVHIMHFIISFFWLFGRAGAMDILSLICWRAHMGRKISYAMYIVFVLAVITVELASQMMRHLHSR
jgi:hypothetical protein